MQWVLIPTSFLFPSVVAQDFGGMLRFTWSVRRPHLNAKTLRFDFSLLPCLNCA